MMDKNWFERWFDTPYYHLLYAHRDPAEAARFLDRLLAYLMPPPDAHIIDLGCGAGRHAHHLAQRGYHVTGLDLSAHSIALAQRMGHLRAAFKVHDMRMPYKVACAEYVFSLFTSMGFFKADEVQSRVLGHVAAMLRPGGYFVLDYLNSTLVGKQPPTTQHLQEKGVSFTARKWVTGGFVHKQIVVQDGAQQFDYEEHVRLYTHEDWTALLGEQGLEVLASFGSYELTPFDAEHTPRLILLAKKKLKI